MPANLPATGAASNHPRGLSVAERLARLERSLDEATERYESDRYAHDPETREYFRRRMIGTEIAIEQLVRDEAIRGERLATSTLDGMVFSVPAR